MRIVLFVLSVAAVVLSIVVIRARVVHRPIADIPPETFPANVFGITSGLVGTSVALLMLPGGIYLMFAAWGLLIIAGTVIGVAWLCPADRWYTPLMQSNVLVRVVVGGLLIAPLNPVLELVVTAVFVAWAYRHSLHAYVRSVTTNN